MVRVFRHLHGLAARPGGKSALAVTALVAGLIALGAGGYYFQALLGHARLMLTATPIEELVGRPGTDAGLREQLRLVQKIRGFASEKLALPDNESYREYVATGREHLLWSVTAVPELSLTPRQWCYPIIGCQSYRGYFSEERARRFGNRLEREGYEVMVRGVGAYSTLGWLADPVTDIMLRRSNPALAEAIFHELAHQQIYVPGDTRFNEGYATFVGEEGVRQWLRARGELDLLERRQAHRQRMRRFNEMLRDKRDELAALYASERPEEEMRVHKNRIIDSIHREFHRRLVAADPDMARIDSWFDRPVTNARLASIAVYRHWVVAFDELLRRHDGDWAAFHAAVRELAGLPQPLRTARMEAYLPGAEKPGSKEVPEARPGTS